MNKKILILSAAGAVVVAGAVGGFLLLKPKASPAAAAAAPAAHGEHGEKAPAASGEEAIVTMDTFLVNLTSAQGDRFAKIDLQLTVAPANVAHEMQEDELLSAKLRDRVLTLLTSKAAEDLMSPIGKEGVRREIKASLNPLLHEGEIQDVLFANFVVQ